MYYHLHHVMMTKERSFYIVVISLAAPPNAPLSGEDAYSGGNYGYSGGEDAYSGGEDGYSGGEDGAMDSEEGVDLLDL